MHPAPSHCVAILPCICIWRVRHSNRKHHTPCKTLLFFFFLSFFLSFSFLLSSFFFLLSSFFLSFLCLVVSAFHVLLTMLFGRRSIPLPSVNNQPRKRMNHTHSLTHPLTHSHTHSLTHSLTHSHTHALTHSQSHTLTHSLVVSIRKHAFTQKQQKESDKVTKRPGQSTWSGLGHLHVSALDLLEKALRFLQLHAQSSTNTR